MTVNSAISNIQTTTTHAMEEAALRLVVDENLPLLRREVVQFPTLSRDSAGMVELSGGHVEREVIVRDASWFGRTKGLFEIFNEARARVSTSPSSYADFLQTDLLHKLFYLEDQQMWATVPVFFCTDCPWTVEELSKLSWQAPAAGRISTSFHSFQCLVLAQGFRCQVIQRLPENDVPTPGFGVVKGATGNY